MSETNSHSVAAVLGAFVTGSQAYGTAKPESDIDLVCFVSEETKQQLIDLAGGFPVRFGKLNLILETSVGKVAAWKAAREECIQHNKQLLEKGLDPLSRDEAVRIHNDFGIGLDGPCPSGPEREFSDDY